MIGLNEWLSWRQIRVIKMLDVQTESSYSKSAKWFSKVTTT